MTGIDLFEAHQWYPFAWLGFTSSYFALEKHVIIYTWAALVILFILAVIARYSMRHPNSLLYYVVSKFSRFFMTMTRQSLHHHSYYHFATIVTFFSFLLVCNCLIAIPSFEEPTKSLNTTLALSLISFMYVQGSAIYTHGLMAYLNEYFKTPLPVFGRYQYFSLRSFLDTAARSLLNVIIGCATFPIEALSKAATILSLSFRLFGNIFGGSVIQSLWMHFKSGSVLWQVVGMASGLNIILMFFFGIFEGTVQAFVFTLLTLTYLSMAINEHRD